MARVTKKKEPAAATRGIRRDHVGERHAERRRHLPILCLTTLGIVYGDIGTSPIYALRECFRGSGATPRLAVNGPNVFGILSLITWSLLVIISLKYLLYVMRADNKGEGGILALLALMQRKGRRQFWFAAMSVFGAALLFGDGMITPAISVLSAVEGLKIATPVFQHYVIPITIGILLALFFFQRQGTRIVGLVFGPLMMLWFLTLAILGAGPIFQNPSVLKALNPWYAIEMFYLNGWLGFTVLGAVFLVVTGGEALYADLGHFGRLPIRAAWFVVVLPSLLLNYFGQGALILSNPKAAEHPFFFLAPAWALYGVVALATLAAVVASQAIISGVFSLTRQAIQLDEFPRVEIIQTSEKEVGQIYAPLLNWLLMFACIGLVVSFRTSSNLAAAYGVAVTTTMVLTTVLLAKVARDLWRWSRWLVALVTTSLLIVDLAFFGANILKFVDGGWFPLAVGGVIFFVMTTWRSGRQLLWRRLRKMEKPLSDFLRSIAQRPPLRVPGTSIFLTGRRQGVPTVLIHHLKHNKVLSDDVILLNVLTEDIPHVLVAERIEEKVHTQGFRHLTLKFGFMDVPDVPKALEELKSDEFDLAEVTYYIGRQTPIPMVRSPGMALWREKFFAFLLRNATHPVDFLKIPPEQVVELGLEIEI